MLRILFLFFPFFLVASPLSDYLDLLATYPETLGPIGSWKEGEIEIVLTPEAIQEIESMAEKRLLDKGTPPEKAKAWSRVGIIAEDQYLYWIRDGVIFPSGAKGTYDRIVWKSSLQGPAGVAIFATLETEEVLLNLNYRHATRSWELELPRGMRKQGETAEAAAKRELKEETGAETDSPSLLGVLAPDSGILSNAIPVYAAKIVKFNLPRHDASEAIHSNIVLSPEELKLALSQGFLDITHADEIIRAFIRDPFLTFALTQLEF